MKDRILIAEKLTKTYTLPAEKIHAIRDIDLAIHAGDFIAIMGPSGSGKTTLLDSLGCLTQISQGKLTVLGQDVSHAGESRLVTIRREYIGFIFQDFLLIPSLSAVENVLLPLYFSRKPCDRAKAVALLNRVGLAHRINHRPAQLSGGEKQRVAIARSLISQPKLLFADEPTGNLDTKISQEIFALFQELNREYDLAVVIVTHNQSLGDQAGRTIHLQDGRIVADKSS
jgi:ABC-type lipoprotein export system ATPase subunit